MNVLLIGGASSLMNQLIKKMNKEGHRVSLLTGNRYRQENYERVFERYDFPYDSTNITDVFQSVTPDVTIFLGAFDRNFQWNNAQGETVRFISGLMNLLMGFSAVERGRFLFLSSDVVYGADSKHLLGEDAPMDPSTIHGMAISQGEELCESFHTNRGLDVVIARLGGYYYQPTRADEADTLIGRMCLEALKEGRVTARAEHMTSLLDESDAVQFIGQLAGARTHRYSRYNLTSGEIVSEEELAEWVSRALAGRRKRSGEERTVRVAVDHGAGAFRRVLSNRRFKEEFGVNRVNQVEARIPKILDAMLRHEDTFLQDREEKPSWRQRVKNRAGWLITAMIPFLENLICFIPFFMLNNRATGSQYFAKLDFYLLYVLLFAIVFGQQQATFSAMLATAGYFFRQTYTRTGFDVLLDYNTYVWVAQLFILGLVVGYMKDRLDRQREEAREDHTYMVGQMDDIREINDVNIRVKDALQAQIINQRDSLGKVYEITSSLDRYSADEVLFYAAEILENIMECEDISIYTVNGGPYARLFTATSELARRLGNSVKYVELEGFYQDISQRRVFINRKLDGNLPMMAGAIYEEEEVRLLVMIWKLPWEKMTLGQANLLAVTNALIRDAVLRANRYLEAMHTERFVGDTVILKADAFANLLAIYRNAESRELTDFSLLEAVVGPGEDRDAVSQGISKKLRPNDYIGELPDGRLYILLTNTDDNGAQAVVGRMKDAGFTCRRVDEFAG